ncbi:hypothetical protein GJ496_008137 [Pomphorhynchus laevis]|nr:hypothetical protein GJ496_008137 [Pomphorhynchus laevis]
MRGTTEINGIQTSANSNQLFNLNADQQSKNSHADVCSICGKRLRLLNNQKLNTRSEVSSPTAECLACDIGCNNNPNPNTFSASCEKSLSAFTSYPGIFREEGKHEYQSVVELFTEEQAEWKLQKDTSISHNNPVLNSSGQRNNLDIKSDDKNPVLICKYITDNLIGKDTVLHTPFGYFKVIYLDYTASGRNVKFIEAFIRQHVLPVYANTHSESSCCSEQTEKYREEARSIIRRCVNASDKDVVLFVGTGTTGAIHKIVDTLNLKTGHTNKVTLVLSALEHHSNILPWKESGVEVIRIPLNKEGNMCIGTLTKTLKKLSSENRIILCSFTAASNVTGILLDVDNISSIVHSYGGYVFWDYAAAAPYIKINMNTSDSSYKDAIFLSGHKFIGGPGSPGVLIAKYFLFKNPVPTNPGGGAVLMVTKSTHIYLGNIEKREEGGTPDIIGSIRFGLAFQLKRSIGDKYIEMREQVLCEKFFNRLSSNRRIIILGNCKQKRLPIFSFLIVHQVSGLLLHHNFIARILNDLFGIQGRPGCVCAGPYTQDLLDIDEEFALKLVALQSSSSCKDINGSVNGNIKNENMNSLGIMKAGFTRISLPFFFSDSMINEIIDIIQFVADNGWYFLPQYYQLVGIVANTGKDVCDISLYNWFLDNTT